MKGRIQRLHIISIPSQELSIDLHSSNRSKRTLAETSRSIEYGSTFHNMSSVVLTGPENIQPWLHGLVRRARHSGCHHILFPTTTTAITSSPSSSSPSSRPSPRHGSHLQGIADRLQREAACRLVRESVPGPIWAYMLTLVVDADELFADPALAVRVARVAAARSPDAPVTERDWHRLRYELRGGRPDDYPTRAHYEQGRRWLDAVTRRHRLGQGLA